jgi:transcriptional regulator with XRE-family HTH domain
MEILLTAEIRGELARRNKSQGWLAQHLGLTQGQVSQRLTRKVEFTVAEVDRVARAFGIPVSELFRRAEAAGVPESVDPPPRPGGPRGPRLATSHGQTL